MSFLATRLTRICQSPIMHIALNTALRFKIVALIGMGLYQVSSLMNGRAGAGNRRYLGEFLGDRAEELWGVAIRGKDGVWVEARREFKAKWCSERHKSRKTKMQRQKARKERGHKAGKVVEPEGKGKKTILRITLPWSGNRKN